jgi:hypothetical protein
VDIGQFAETGADAVDHPALRDDFLDHLARCPNSRMRGRGHSNRCLAVRDLRNFRKRQRLASQLHGSHLID